MIANLFGFEPSPLLFYSGLTLAVFLLAYSAWEWRRKQRQAYFWTEDWQEGERRADADFAAGRCKEFADFESLARDLRDGVA